MASREARGGAGNTTRSHNEPQKQEVQLWTEISKDLVLSEALIKSGYEFEETEEYWYVLKKLAYEDVVQLVVTSDDIRDDRRRRIKGIERENQTTMAPSSSRTTAEPAAPYQHDSSQPNPQGVRDSSERNRPTWVRIACRHLLPETLDAYHLKWDYDSEDDSYLIINEYISHELQRELFAHTKAIRNRRASPKPTSDIVGPVPKGFDVFAGRRYVR